MKRLFLYLILAALVIGAVRAMHHRPARMPKTPPPARWHHGPGPDDDRARREATAAEARRQARQAAAETRRALEEAGREVRHAYREARDEMGRALREARDEIRRAYREAVADRGGRPPLPPPPPPPPAPIEAPELEEADGLPVPIIAGTRVTEAEARPPVPARPEVPECPASAGRPPACDVPATAVEAGARYHRAVAGDICATEDRARDDARKVLRTQVAEWLTPDVPASWNPPAGMLEGMILATRIDPIDKPYGTLYKAELTADFSPGRRAGLVETYGRDLVHRRLVSLAGAIGFVLVCLAALSGYIRADEATRGYYTNRLRMLTAAGVGAAGVIVYRLLA